MLYNEYYWSISPDNLGLGELCWHNFEHKLIEAQASSIIDNLKSIIVQIVQTKACLEEESVI